MCLQLSRTATDDLRSAIVAAGGTLKLFKCYRIDSEKNIVSPVTVMPVEIAEDGTIASNRPARDFTTSELEVDTVTLGIHGTTTAEHASEFYAGNRKIIVEATATAEDFVGTNADKTHLVFMKITVNREAVQAAVDAFPIGHDEYFDDDDDDDFDDDDDDDDDDWDDDWDDDDDLDDEDEDDDAEDD